MTHQCPLCPKKYADKGGLKRHTKKEHSESPIVCALCPTTTNMKFASEWHLTRHTNSKHSLAPTTYPCPECGTGYTRRDIKCASDACRASRPREAIRYHGERAIALVLDELKAPYQHDRVYLPFNDKQRYDFIVWTTPLDGVASPRAMIEYNGIQHTRPVAFGGDEEKALASYVKTLRHDAMKDQYCADNAYPLLRIPHTVKKKDIAQIVRDFLADPINYVQPIMPSIWRPQVVA